MVNHLFVWRDFSLMKYSCSYYWEANGFPSTKVWLLAILALPPMRITKKSGSNEWVKLFCKEYQSKFQIFEIHAPPCTKVSSVACLLETRTDSYSTIFEKVTFFDLSRKQRRCCIGTPQKELRQSKRILQLVPHKEIKRIWWDKEEPIIGCLIRFNETNILT